MIKEFPAKAEGHRLMGRLLFRKENTRMPPPFCKIHQHSAGPGNVLSAGSGFQSRRFGNGRDPIPNHSGLHAHVHPSPDHARRDFCARGVAWKPLPWLTKCLKPTFWIFGDSRCGRTRCCCRASPRSPGRPGRGREACSVEPRRAAEERLAQTLSRGCLRRGSRGGVANFASGTRRADGLAYPLCAVEAV